MEITKTNFKEALSEFENAIADATFLAIDGEFTGLNQEWNLNAYDTPEERYNKLRQGAMDFMIIQFGVCTFHYDELKEKFTHQAFNFYTFPRNFGKNYPDPRFFCQSSSLEFLASQGFDFNKLIKEGIPFLRRDQEDKLREALDRKHALQQQSLTPKSSAASEINGEATPKTPTAIPADHQEFISNIHLQIDTFLANEEKCLQLTACTAYRRKLIYESVRSKYSGLDLETVMTEKRDRYIQVRKSSDEEMQDRAQEKMETEKIELDDAVGFTKVIRRISESKKLIVGHNMLLDLLHIVNQFLCPLPENYDDFKILTNSVFPKVLDTKLMSSTRPLKDLFISTALNDLLKGMHESPLKPVTADAAEDKKGYSTDKEQLHEAGYDAYITGLCFISMTNYLGSLQKLAKKTILPDSPLVDAYVNKLHMMLSPDIPYMNLTGQDLKPSRDHVFHVSFPPEWKTSDLMQLFSPYGTIFISWLNSTSAFVSLKWPEQATNAKSLVLEKNSLYTVKLYSDYVQKQRRSSSGSAPILKDKTGPVPFSDLPAPAPKRRRSSSTSDVTSTSRVCEPIPEEEDDEKNEAEEPNQKKQKLDADSPRKKLFEEPDSWT